MTSAASYAMRTAREVLARVRELNPTPELALSERTDLRFVSILYSGAGILTYPALGFYAVSLRFEGAAHLHESVGGLARSRRLRAVCSCRCQTAWSNTPGKRSI